MSASHSGKRRKQAKATSSLAVCVRTSKLCFTSRKRALSGMNNAKGAHARGERTGRRPVAVYHCSFCGEWHLTSQPQRAAST